MPKVGGTPQFKTNWQGYNKKKIDEKRKRPTKHFIKN